MKKYELTTDTKVIFGKKYFRIKALVDFGSVSKGDLGGYIESENNLENNTVDGNAWVDGNARVDGDARVGGNACVDGDARVGGNAWVDGNARVGGNAWVDGDADYTTIRGFGTEFRNTTFFRCKDDKIRVKCGCFYGDLEEFRQQVKDTRDGKIAKEYLMIADLMEYHFSEDE